MKFKTIVLFIQHLVISIFVIIVVFPIFWTLITSLKNQRDAFEFPPKFIFTPIITNYSDVLSQGRFVQFALNSLIIVVISTLIAVCCGSLAAYGLARLKLPGTEFVLVLVLITRFIPTMSTVIPLFLLSNAVGLYDSRVLLILVYAAINIPYVTWMMRAFFKDLSVEVEDAAMLDGCSRFQIFWKIALPLSAPGLSAVSILAIIFSWKEFLYALTLTSVKSSTLPLFIAGFVGDLGIDWPHMTASGILIMLPIFVCSIFIQRKLAYGLTFGSVNKG